MAYLHLHREGHSTGWILAWSVAILLTFVAAALWAQPPCVECCCGDAEEIGFPCGTFEEPPMAAPGGWIDYGAGQSYCGWTVISGSISIHHGDHNNLGAGNPNGSSQHLDLNGSSPGVIERTLTGLTPGSQYTITLWYAAHNGAGTATGRALINNGAWLDFTWSTNVPGNVNWQFLCMSFIADAPTATMRFIGSSDNPCCGMLIDDMSMWACDADLGAPVAAPTPPALLEIPCHESVPPAPVLSVTDDCDDNPEIVLTVQQLTQPCGYDLTRTWTLTDACGQTATTQQVVQVRDTDPPYFIQAPIDRTIPCGSDILQEFYSWLQSNGEAIATDGCDSDPDWTITYDMEPDSVCGETIVTFAVTDNCGNVVQATARFIVADTGSPLLITPAKDYAIHCAPAPGDSLAAWLQTNGGASASDLCEPLIWSHDFQGDSLAPAITVTFTATDGCGNAVHTTATFFQSQGSDTLVIYSQTCDPWKAGSDTLKVGTPGCESVTITHVQLLPSDTVRVDMDVCDPMQVGVDTIFLQKLNGCDSLLIIRRMLVPSDTTHIIGYTCDPASAGLDTVILNNQFGCDSLIITTTLLSLHFQQTDHVLICGQGMNYTDTLMIQTGPCDSLFITMYEYVLPDTTWLTDATCDPSNTGTNVTALQNQFGCDSIIVLVTSLLPSDTVSVVGTTCDPSAAISETVSLMNQYGCDSIVMVHISWVGTDTTFVTRTSCDSLQTGTYVHVLPMAHAPCDSIVVETVNWAAQSITFQAATITCDPSGPAADTIVLTSHAGCDSLVIRPYVYTQLEAIPSIQHEQCAGNRDGQIALTGMSGSHPPWQYRLDNGLWQGGPVFTGIGPGQYSVTMRDDNGCVRTFDGLIVLPGATLFLDAGADVEVEKGQFVPLEITSSTPLTQIQWASTDPILCPACLQTSLGPVTTSQTVHVQGWTDGGCTATDQLQITLKEATVPVVYIPNSFSPNHDGINDIFSIYAGVPITTVRNLAIYDRWGNALYNQSYLPVNDPSAGWNGTFRGKTMDPGVYVYVAVIELPDGITRIYKGDVLLVR